MESAKTFEANKAFRATVNGVEVLYLHGAPTVEDAKKELAVLRGFLTAYKDAKLGALFVRAAQHTSEYTPKEDPHLTFQICTVDQWNNGNPTAHGHNVHVFSKDNKTENGYSSYRIQENRPHKKINSELFKKLISDAHNYHVSDLDLA